MIQSQWQPNSSNDLQPEHKPVFSNTQSKPIPLFIAIAVIIAIAIIIPVFLNSTDNEPSGIVDTGDGIDWDNPPCLPADLGDEWEEITHPLRRARSQRRDFRHKPTGIEIAFDKGTKGARGNKGKNHWHRYNPNSTKGDRDKYLDKNGRPIDKNDNDSHINPNCE